jgi:isopenicillin N synthase-like dioxygenase
MRWTNDVLRLDTAPGRQPAGPERYSIAFFLDPNPETVGRAADLPGRRPSDALSSGDGSRLLAFAP